MKKLIYLLAYAIMILVAAVGIIAIVTIGIKIVTGVDIWENIGPFMVILVGLLIVAGAIYGVTRRR